LGTYALDQMDIDEKEWSKIFRNLPERIKKGQFALLPWKTAEGSIDLLDMTYILPYGDILESRTYQGGFFHNLVAWFGNIIGNVYSDLKSNEIGFTGKDITDEIVDIKARAFSKITDYLYKAIFAPWAPQIPGITEGGYDWIRVKEAYDPSEKTLAWSKNRGMPSALASSLLGLKTTSIDIGIQNAMRILEYKRILDHLTKEMSKTNLKFSNAISNTDDPAKKKELREKGREEMDKLKKRRAFFIEEEKKRKKEMPGLAKNIFYTKPITESNVKFATDALKKREKTLPSDKDYLNGITKEHY